MKARYRFTKPVISNEEKQFTQEHWHALAFTIDIPFTFIGMILFVVFPPGVPLMMAFLVALAAIVVYRDRKSLKQASRAERSIRELRRLVQQAPLPKEAREVSWDWDASNEGDREGMTG
jgi:hypothetical protein